MQFEETLYSQMLPYIKETAEELQIDFSLFRLDVLSNYSSS